MAVRPKPDKLIELHEAVAEHLLVALKEPACDPKIVDAAIKFLKDNAVAVDMGLEADPQKAAQELLSALPAPSSYDDDDEEPEYPPLRAA